ncbi:MAG: GDSL-type esterase/lipase family protein [Bacteroidia bacterium]|nr:GDSL-type esterase/lipase family protein [Bacteroidia bacterium]
MKFRFLFLLSALGPCWLGLRASGPEGILPAVSLFPVGRYELTDRDHIELISSGAHVGFRFRGTSCEVWAYLDTRATHNYLQYTLDGVYQTRIRVAGVRPRAYRIEAPDDGVHTVWLYKATEAHTGPVFLREIGGSRLKALKVPAGPLIEFIGNSITCGAAADPSEVPCGQGAYHDQHHAWGAYGPQVARRLGARFILSSASGIGVYRNWNSAGPVMPDVYDRSDFQADSPRRWDFSRYQPAIVSLALGTNDFSAGDGVKPRLPFDSAAFVSRYVAFVQQVKGYYPQARIALLSSPMLEGERRDQLERCLVAVKQRVDALFPEDAPVALHLFLPMQAQGCTGHPSVADHGVMAAELEPFFRALLP